jgi:hypothetical protein
MRRSIKLTFAFAAVCWCQVQPQPLTVKVETPIPVKVETPAQRPWVRLLEILLSGIVGASGALIAVGLNNKHNAAENAANRNLELEKLNREHSFGLKRDALTRVTQSLVQTIHTLEVWSHARTNPEYLENSGASTAEIQQAMEDIEKAWVEFRLSRTELSQNIASASLAVSDDLWKSAQTIAQSIDDANLHASNRDSGWTSRLEGVQHEIRQFTQDAQKELGIVRIAGTPNRGNDH